MPSWIRGGFGKSLDEQKRDRDQRYRVARVEASTKYLADIASEGLTATTIKDPNPGPLQNLPNPAG